MFILIFFPPLVERLQLPGVLGLIVGGIVVGPFLPGLATPHSPTGELLSELGRVFLMFLAGLEINLKEFRKRARACWLRPSPSAEQLRRFSSVRSSSLAPLICSGLWRKRGMR